MWEHYTRSSKWKWNAFLYPPLLKESGPLCFDLWPLHPHITRSGTTLYWPLTSIHLHTTKVPPLCIDLWPLHLHTTKSGTTLYWPLTSTLPHHKKWHHFVLTFDLYICGTTSDIFLYIHFWAPGTQILPILFNTSSVSIDSEQYKTVFQVFRSNPLKKLRRLHIDFSFDNFEHFILIFCPLLSHTLSQTKQYASYC